MVAMGAAVGGAISNPTQMFDNLPSSLVSLAFMGGGKKPGDRVEYGLAFRFTVHLDDAGDLGDWSSCSGLKYDFSPIEVRSGGDYTSLTYLPNELKHPRIVLKRAVNAKSSKIVQDWLRTAAHDWVTGVDEADGTGGATITLYDATNTAVASWSVVGVRPAVWTGPDLDANSSKVAMETLELVHQGFVPPPASTQPKPQPTTATTLDTKPTRLTLQHGSDIVEFLNTPVSMKVERTTEALALVALDASAGTGNGNEVPLGATANTTRLSLNGLFIVKKKDGKEPKAQVDLLLDWMDATKAARAAAGSQASKKKPTPSPTGESSEDEPNKPELPLLTLSWGGTLVETVRLASISADYVRFDVAGNPTRAKVGMTVTIVSQPKSEQPGQNPTSGGLAGRGAHTVTLGDSLPLIAHDRYGSTARWRDVAEASGIDDPLRVRPGRRLYLPAPTEIAAR